jgi:nucleolar protein 56
MKFVVIQAFSSTSNAIQQCNVESEGILIDDLRIFLNLNLPKVKEGKNPKFILGVLEPKILSKF